MSQEGRRFRRRKKEVWFVDGYFIDHAQDVVPGYARTDEMFHLFGKDDPESDVQHNNGTMDIKLLDKYSNNALLDLMTGQDPGDAVNPRQYRVDMLQSVLAWANVKDEKNTRYIKAILVPGWSPGMPVPTGNANEKAVVQVQGNCDLPRQFEHVWIKSRKVASGGSVSLGDTPVLVPSEGVYAVAVQAIYESGTTFMKEDVEPTAAMVSVAGNVLFSEINAQVTTLPAITHAFVLFLQSGTGVFPNIPMGKLRS